MSIHQIEEEISKVMPLEEFLQIQRRLRELHHEENAKLQALAELQQGSLAQIVMLSEIW